MGTALFALYTPWVTSEVGWEDSAFFQLCHSTLGVPHGPGFPLYMILGRLFAWPFAASPALGSNLLSVTAFAAAGVALFEIILLLGAPEASKARGLAHVAAFTAVAGWAALPVHWPQATRTEVYPLTLFLVLATCYLALRARSGERASCFACAAAWCWGLGMAVHPLITFAAATPWLYFAWRSRVAKWQLLLFACLPMSLYLFAPLRGRLEGVWAWGDFGSLASTLDYFTRRSAWDAVVTTDGGLLENLAGWWSALPDLVPALLWIPALWGLWLARKFWPLLAAFALNLFLVVWAAPFDPTNLDLLGYALPGLAVLAAGAGVLAVRGAVQLWSHWSTLSNARRLVALSMLSLAAWPLQPLAAVGANASSTAGAGFITRSLDAVLPAGATLLVNEDSFFGVLEYAQARGFRTDVRVISLGALRYPFYRRMLKARLPAGSTGGWDEPSVWNETRWRGEVEKLFALRPTEEPWFAPFDRLPGVSAAQLQPRGVVAALSGASPESSWEAGLAYWKNCVNAGVQRGPEQEAMARWIFNFGVLALDRGFSGVGWEAMQLAVEVSPAEPEMYFLLSQALERAGRVGESRALLAAAVEMAPYRKRYREAQERLQPALAVQP